ncbi:MAG: CbbX protein [Candidatus Rokubacteria bacterium RIFCSPLOWO2_12_FULL_69_21]|nr:MAG: CbbX protein [Candidatus Rokubacteria bacterium RIFCSPLOWO2_12_FULL_69_21]
MDHARIDGELLDIAQAFKDSSVQEVLDELDHQLVGLQEVKTRIREIAAFLLVDRLRREVGLTAERPVLHMCFTGRPGTGKTTVAMRMAQILHRLGYIRRDHLVVATRDDLVGQYVGHTAPKTKDVLKKAMGGLLFIDEAYYLYRRENERDYGQETIEILLQVMEQQREGLVVILAGYKERMDEFFRSNPGMRSRVAHHLDFPDFTPDELEQIAEMMLGQQMYFFTQPAREAFRAYLTRRMALPDFANARSVRNAIDRIKLRHANRIYSGSGPATREDLARIDATDILKSRVFQDLPGDPPSGEPAGAPSRVGERGKNAI